MNARWISLKERVVTFGLFQSPNMREIMSGATGARSGGASAIVAISRLMGRTLGAGLVAQCFHWWPVSGAHMALCLGGGVRYSAASLAQCG